MRNAIWAGIVAGSLAVIAPTFTANASAQTPKDATAKCKDGTYTTAKTQRGACSGHGGVAKWTGATNSSGSLAAAPTNARSAAPAAPTAAAPTPPTQSAPAPPAPTAAPAATRPVTQ